MRPEEIRKAGHEGFADLAGRGKDVAGDIEVADGELRAQDEQHRHQRDEPDFAPRFGESLMRQRRPVGEADLGLAFGLRWLIECRQRFA